MSEGYPVFVLKHNLSIIFPIYLDDDDNDNDDNNNNNNINNYY
jgi:hypothetical protein